MACSGRGPRCSRRHRCYCPPQQCGHRRCYTALRPTLFAANFSTGFRRRPLPIPPVCLPSGPLRPRFRPICPLFRQIHPIPRQLVFLASGLHRPLFPPIRRILIRRRPLCRPIPSTIPHQRPRLYCHRPMIRRCHRPTSRRCHWIRYRCHHQHRRSHLADALA